MLPRYEYGDAVRVVRNVRNDGTYPGMAMGNLLVRRGSVGYVMNVGTFLQDQLIYTVHFLDQDRVIGCREEELIGADEPWTPSRFETREKVRAALTLAVDGEVLVPAGTEGEVMRVVRDTDVGVQYHVHFPGHVLQVPERVLAPLVECDEQEGD
ncbi:nitrogen fixation protein NifZ [Parasulfuritortus cantonensis]|uniref:Nitrogen fixation protein NifZ n=1 Tax=Parasulfuritortus cantonensis TaxID=2528202 RepID=A0A4R1B649_9PROT|nr:nitrogen fixation protein NifZ [Parasulfuritortus cantonensis]TCJ11708.1 nitrogen fixation protein NifZ [Parasulfuritortus cantonensis]